MHLTMKSEFFSFRFKGFRRSSQQDHARLHPKFIFLYLKCYKRYKENFDYDVITNLVKMTCCMLVEVFAYTG